MRARRWRVLAVVMIFAVGACSGGDDDATGDDHDHNGGHDVAIDQQAAGDRCDVGVNTAEFNETTRLVDEPHHHEPGTPVDFTLREWAEVFVDEEVSGVTVDQVVDYFEADPRRGAELRRGEGTTRLGPDDWVPTTDSEDCAELADQIQQARDAAARYPTVADAKAAGYAPGSFYAPGGGAHYANSALIGDGFNPAEPDLLMFDGHEDDSHIVGVMYFILAPDGLPDDEDVGFVGPNDGWHSHPTACRSPEGLTVPQAECDAGRGEEVDTSFGWMAHAWVVPGCENDWGVFSEANPRLPILSGRDPSLQTQAATGPPSPFESGCNSGRTLDDPLELDDAGAGPTVT